MSHRDFVLATLALALALASVAARREASRRGIRFVDRVAAKKRREEFRAHHERIAVHAARRGRAERNQSVARLQLINAVGQTDLHPGFSRRRNVRVNYDPASTGVLVGHWTSMPKKAATRYNESSNTGVRT